jgi:hypothetical protein
VILLPQLVDPYAGKAGVDHHHAPAAPPVGSGCQPFSPEGLVGQGLVMLCVDEQLAITADKEGKDMLRVGVFRD